MGREVLGSRSPCPQSWRSSSIWNKVWTKPSDSSLPRGLPTDRSYRIKQLKAQCAGIQSFGWQFHDTAKVTSALWAPVSQMKGLVWGLWFSDLSLSSSRCHRWCFWYCLEGQELDMLGEQGSSFSIPLQPEYQPFWPTRASGWAFDLKKSSTA